MIVDACLVQVAAVFAVQTGSHILCLSQEALLLQALRQFVTHACLLEHLRHVRPLLHASPRAH
jgi:hypothetical protein